MRNFQTFLICVLFLALLALVSGCGESEELQSQNSAQNSSQDDILSDTTPELTDSVAFEEEFRQIRDLSSNPDFRTDTATIQPNQGLFQAFMDIGLDNNTNLQLINALRFDIELENLRAGAEFLVTRSVKDSNYVERLLYKPHPALIYRLKRKEPESPLKLDIIRKPTTFEYSLYTDTLAPGSSLDQTLLGAKIPPNLTQTVNGILLCKISFRTDARAGDQFRVIMRDEYYGDTLIDSRVVYTSYSGVRTGFHEAFRYDDGPKSTYTAHYTSDGEALIHSGLRYPVDRLHISSGYGYRIHPITGRRAFHAGVDYASPTGSPVYSVAQGKVVVSGYDKYSGNKIAVRHSDGSTSYYLHLSRRGVNNGAFVRGGQVIGRVGSTGRSTGPHLHFGFKTPAGKWMNPLQKRMIATPKLEGERLAQLETQIQYIRVQLSDLLSQWDYEREFGTVNTPEFDPAEVEREVIQAES